MIYLESEKKVFEQVKAVFEEAYLSLMNGMYDTFKEKGKARDVGSPIHHRMSPKTMVALAQAKMRRIEMLISIENWEEDLTLHFRIIEECCDVANYNLFLAALCSMLQDQKVTGRRATRGEAKEEPK